MVTVMVLVLVLVRLDDALLAPFRLDEPLAFVEACVVVAVRVARG